MKEVRNTLEGRRLIQWSDQNPQPPKNKRNDYAVADIECESGFVFSIFRSYEDIARLRRRREAEGRPDQARSQNAFAQRLAKDLETRVVHKEEGDPARTRGIRRGARRAT